MPEESNLLGAHWLWPEAATTTPNTYVEFRRVFLHQGNPNVLLHVSACQEYLLYLNGHLIGRGPSPCTPTYQYYDTYDVTKHLVTGINCLAAVCYHFGDKDIVTQQMQGEAGFLLTLESTNTVVVTDEQWCCRVSPRWATQTARISRWGGYNEIYLAQREDGWEQTAYDDTAWQQATVRAAARDTTSPWPRLIAREIPLLKLGTVFPERVARVDSNDGSVTGHWLGQGISLRIDASHPGSLPGAVLDFGKEVVGWPALVLETPAGGVVRLAYGESLELQYVDTFVLKPGSNKLSPYGRRACRYLQVTLMATPEPVEVKDLSFLLQHYDFKETGDFKTDDSLLSDIWSISHHTTLMNSQDHLEDCPWREKALWIADAVVMGKVIYHVFGDKQLMRKCLLQGARIQNEDGSIPGTGPEANTMLLPDFCGHWLLGVRDYWRFSGDTKFLEEIWDTVVRLIAWFAAQKDETGLFAGANRPGWWCFIDWTEHIDKRDKVTAVSCLHYAGLEAVAELAEALGKVEADHYRQEAETLAQDIRAHLWLPGRGAFADCMNGSEVSDRLSLQTNFMAIWCGLMTDEEAQRFIETYYDGPQLPAISGAFFQHIVLEVFCHLKRKTEALALVKHYWGAMVARGATTWWETFDPSSPLCTTPSTYQGNVPTYLWEGPLVSRCHGWGASPGYLLHHLVTGVDVFHLGKGLVHLNKPVDGPTRLHSVIPTHHGPITVDWQRENGELFGSIRLPSSLTYQCSADFPATLTLIREENAYK